MQFWMFQKVVSHFWEITENLGRCVHGERIICDTTWEIFLKVAIFLGIKTDTFFLNHITWKWNDSLNALNYRKLLYFLTKWEISLPQFLEVYLNLPFKVRPGLNFIALLTAKFCVYNHDSPLMWKRYLCKRRIHTCRINILLLTCAIRHKHRIPCFRKRRFWR